MHLGRQPDDMRAAMPRLPLLNSCAAERDGFAWNLTTGPHKVRNLPNRFIDPVLSVAEDKNLRPHDHRLLDRRPAGRQFIRLQPPGGTTIDPEVSSWS